MRYDQGTGSPSLLSRRRGSVVEIIRARYERMAASHHVDDPPLLDHASSRMNALNEIVVSAR
jgi:hypothetical protein